MYRTCYLSIQHNYDITIMHAHTCTGSKKSAEEVNYNYSIKNHNETFSVVSQLKRNDSEAYETAGDKPHVSPHLYDEITQTKQLATEL